LPVLEDKFGVNIIHDLLTLALNNKLTTKTDKRNPNNEVIYFRLNSKLLL
jgi:biotin carboxylase